MPEPRVSILLVDDQAIDRRALVRYVQAENFPYDVAAVGSLAEAGALLARRTFDIAVIDQRLGDGVGVALFPSLSGTPAVILTRTGDEAIAAQAVRAGAYGFLVRDSGRRYLQLLAPTVTVVLARRRGEIAASMRAEELARTRDEFQRVASMMWHEVVAPLTTLLSTLEMIQIDAEENPSILPPDTLGMIKQNVEIAARLERSISDVLGYYRLQAPPALVPVDLDALVGEVIANLPVTAWHDAVVEKDALPHTTGDPTRLRLLFRQLLDNAQSLRGSDPLVIHVGASEYDDSVRVSVTDNGVGLMSNDRGCVVGPHDQPGDADTGLGMAICKRIAEQHGGRIWFEWVPGAGTTVHVALPRPLVSAPPTRTAAE